MDNLSKTVYAIVMLVSLALAWWLMQRKQRSLSLSSRERALLGFAAFIGAMLGAKLPFIGQLGWDGILSGATWFVDGKTILGGIFGGYLAVEVAKVSLGIRVGTGDAFAVPIAIAVLIGRIGCFWAGCCFGQVTHLPWGISFPLAADRPGVLRHPTQIYEVIFHAFAIVALLLAERHDWCRGQRLKAYLLAYLGYRFVSEWIRPETRVLWELTIYQIACVLLSLILVALWFRDARRPEQSPTLPLP